MLCSLFFYMLVASTVDICETSTTTQTPSESLYPVNLTKISVKIIQSCDVGTTNLYDDVSRNDIDGNEHCILYQNASKYLCFSFGGKTATYEEASRVCADQGMEIASITQPHVLDILIGLLNKQNVSENVFWVNIPNSTWESISNWSNDYSRYYNTCEGKYKDKSEKKACPFVMSKPGNTKLILRQMHDEKDCFFNWKVFCQGNVQLSSTDDPINPPIIAIIGATSVGVLMLLIVVGLIIRSLKKYRIHSHNRMENSSKSDTSSTEDKKNNDRYAVAGDIDGKTLKGKKGDEYADYAELDDGVSEVDKHAQKKLLKSEQNDAVDSGPSVNTQTSTGDDVDQPCYFVLNKQESVESLQHTYEDCAFKDIPSTSTLPMRYNPIALTLPAVRPNETDENVYDWPDILQPTNYTAKTRRTQSETEPQYFSLEIEDNDERENIYDCVFPIEEPLHKSPKPSRTKHLSLPRKKRKSKQHDHVKSRFNSGIRQ